MCWLENRKIYEKLYMLFHYFRRAHYIYATVVKLYAYIYTYTIGINPYTFHA